MWHTDTEFLKQISSGMTGRDRHRDGRKESYWQARNQVSCRTRGLYAIKCREGEKDITEWEQKKTQTVEQPAGRKQIPGGAVRSPMEGPEGQML